MKFIYCWRKVGLAIRLAALKEATTLATTSQVKKNRHTRIPVKKLFIFAILYLEKRGKA